MRKELIQTKNYTLFVFYFSQLPRIDDPVIKYKLIEHSMNVVSINEQRDVITYLINHVHDSKDILKTLNCNKTILLFADVLLKHFRTVKKSEFYRYNFR